MIFGKRRIKHRVDIYLVPKGAEGTVDFEDSLDELMATKLYEGQWRLKTITCLGAAGAFYRVMVVCERLVR